MPGSSPGMTQNNERRPRESGDPVRRELSNSTTAGDYWMPAFAGMTLVGLEADQERSRATTRNHKGFCAFSVLDSLA
jgi:hypothetical protein